MKIELVTWRDAGGEVGGGTSDLSGVDDGWVSQSVHDHGAGKPVGAEQHDRFDRAACRLDFRLPGVPGAAAGGLYRGVAGG